MPMYHDSNRELQDRFGSTQLADRLVERLWRDRFKDEDKAFIESCDMFFLATADEHGRPSCSYKGGDPGFVRVLDSRTLAEKTRWQVDCNVSKVRYQAHTNRILAACGGDAGNAADSSALSADLASRFA